LLKDYFSYDENTGKFTWIKKGKGRSVGDVAGYLIDKGYLRITIQGEKYYAHRLAWLYIYGVFPKNGTDHINGIRNDNRINNLREANQSENLQNLSVSSKNTSGYIGVSLNKKTKKWCAQIKSNNKKYYLGEYHSPEIAHEVYCKAKLEMHTFNPMVRL
jgi:hypothetical protein